ncbi:MAG: HipA N-terminal domain-containing protein [Verrucomicrobia bacterium]|nr:HipA N-terminal domain-containing protein [Verrucomicrobiota bacterium]
MRRAEVYQTGTLAGYLTETESKGYRFDYLPGYRGHPISLTMPVRPEPYQFENLPPFFEGLLPEGRQLEALLRTRKLDRHDLLGQLLAVGEDVVGSVVIIEVRESSLTESERTGGEET